VTPPRPVPLAIEPILDRVRDFVFVLRVDGPGEYVCLTANERCLDAIGRAREEIVGRRLQDIAPPEFLPLLTDAAEAVLRQQTPVRFEQEADFPAGHVIGEIELTRAEGPDGSVLLLGVAHDVTPQRRAEEETRATEARFAALVEHSSDMVTVMDAGGNVVYGSPSITTVLGWSMLDFGEPSAEHDRYPPVWELVHPDDVQAVANAFLETVTEGRAYARVEFRMRHRDGSWRWIEAVATNRLDDPAVRGIVVNSRDVTARKEMEAALTHQALHDPLTDLPNRALLVDRIEQALRRLGRHPGRVAVLFLDLDRFKVVNDSLGHAAGDHLLVEVAQRLAAASRPGDTIARFGGDEFVVLCEELHHENEAITIVGRLADALARPFLHQGRELSLTASVGIASSDDPTVDPAALLRDADAAMYSAKDRGRARHEVFDSALHDHAVARLDLEVELRQALDRHELCIEYQPVVRLADDRVIGAEALLRWQHPDRGLLAPADFIDIAEETGLIVPIGEWTLREACAELARWRGSERDDAPPSLLAVNVSGRQLAHTDFVSTVAAAIDGAGIDATQLCIEITETAVLHQAGDSDRTLAALRALGVNVALDDFGTGYSSLGYLRRMPVDIVKIDGSFIEGLGRDRESTAIVAAVVALADALSLTTVAEGIESAEQLEQVAALGVDWVQGHYYSAPIASSALSSVPERAADLVAG
jgi:diguanylate cyclase (GGDEF)-like protein/PAS domain S-box-containing protein